MILWHYLPQRGRNQEHIMLNQLNRQRLVWLLAIASCLVASRPAFSQASPSPASPSLATPSAAPSAADPVAELLNQGDRALVSQHYEDALNAFQKANKLRHGDCAACFFGVAVAQARLGESDDAIKSCDKTLSLAKDDATLVATHTLKGNVL
jgi:tetratricopeptide (TPR) repeat protein